MRQLANSFDWCSNSMRSTFVFIPVLTDSEYNNCILYVQMSFASFLYESLKLYRYGQQIYISNNQIN